MPATYLVRTWQAGFFEWAVGSWDGDHPPEEEEGETPNSLSEEGEEGEAVTHDGCGAKYLPADYEWLEENTEITHMALFVAMCFYFITLSLAIWVYFTTLSKYNRIEKDGGGGKEHTAIVNKRKRVFQAHNGGADNYPGTYGSFLAEQAVKEMEGWAAFSPLSWAIVTTQAFFVALAFHVLCNASHWIYRTLTAMFAASSIYVCLRRMPRPITRMWSSSPPRPRPSHVTTRPSLCTPLTLVMMR